MRKGSSAQASSSKIMCPYLNLFAFCFCILPPCLTKQMFCWALNNESQFIFSPIYWYHPTQSCREGRTLLVLCFPQLVQMKHSTGLQMYWQIMQKKARVFSLWMNTIWDMLRTATNVCKDSEYKFGDLYGNGRKEGDLAVGLCFIYKMSCDQTPQIFSTSRHKPWTGASA